MCLQICVPGPIATALFLMGAATVIAAGPAQGRPAAQPAADRGLVRYARLIAGLVQHSPQAISTPVGDAPEQFDAAFALDGRPVMARLVRQSRRADGFTVLEDVGGGVLTQFDPGPVRTYRGTLDDDPGARIAAYLAADGGLTARISTGDSTWYIESAPGFTPDGRRAHVIYNRADTGASSGACGAAGGPAVGAAPVLPPGGPPGPRGGSPPFLRAQIAFDADYEYFDEYGSTSAVVAQIEANMNDCADIYEDDVDLCWEITVIIVRTSSSDPYSDEEDASDLLDEFTDHWNANFAATPRTTAHLMTGKDLTGGTIGIAWVGGIACSGGAPDRSLAYGLQEDIVIQSRRTELCAHEIGHNWNACHCDDASDCVEIDDCGIMSSAVGLTEGRTWFSQFSQNQIETHIASVSSCQLIECGCGYTILVPEFPFSTIENAVAAAPCGSVVSIRSGSYTVGGPLNSGPGRTVRIVARGGTVVIDHE